MANLKGGTYEKQIKDAFHRLEAFGKGRYGTNDHLTHSDCLATKREMYLNDYKNYLQENGYSEKLNQTLTNENVQSFFNKRLEGLKHSTQENYVRGFSSLIQGLQEVNITVNIDNTVFDSKVVEIKETAAPDTRTGLAIVDSSEKIEQLYGKRYESGVLSEVMKNLGVRISEGYEIVKNLDTYYNPTNGTIENLTGKGNHPYAAKAISTELVEKIKVCDNVPSQNTYRNDLKGIGINKPHQWRFSYAKTEFEKKIDNGNGIEYRQALKELSEELNHSNGGTVQNSVSIG
ncbi:MAG: hypothetical protein LT067_07620 [Sulfurovum sp.]|nr:hypothetical protein [Sulfurovum sp.]